MIINYNSWYQTIPSGEVLSCDREPGKWLVKLLNGPKKVSTVSVKKETILKKAISKLIH